MSQEVEGCQLFEVQKQLPRLAKYS